MYEKVGWSIHGLNPRSVAEAGYKPFLPVPASRGKRCIILAALCEAGIVPDSTFIGEGGFTDDGDYHKTMTSAIFEEWLEQRLIPNVAQISGDRKVALVIDNASYHGRTAFSKEFSSKPKKKDDIRAWLDHNSVPYEKTDTVPILKDLMEQAIQELGYDVSVVEEICKHAVRRFGKNFTIVRQPPYHSVFNSIELFWSQMKALIRNEIRPGHKIEDIILMVQQFCDNFTPEKAQNLMAHTAKEEEKFREIYARQEIPIHVDPQTVRDEIQAPAEFVEDAEDLEEN